MPVIAYFVSPQLGEKYAIRITQYESETGDLSRRAWPVPGNSGTSQLKLTPSSGSPSFFRRASSANQASSTSWVVSGRSSWGFS